MPSNIEIKARVADAEGLREIARGLATEPCQVLQQEDVFFRAPTGRLKLRILAEDRGELIAYERPDTSESKQSHYQIHETDKPAGLRNLLAASLGEVVIVKKKREVWLVGQTRIHLDEVEELGTFMELEVVLAPGQDPEEGRRIASELMGTLGIGTCDLVACAYADLLMGG